MAKRLLAVEGADDQHVVWHLLEKHEVENCFEVKDLNGIENILKGLGIMLKAYDRFGVIIDADIDLESRWRSVRTRVAALGFDLPKKPTLGGYCSENIDGKIFGVWLMPNNVLPGMLEDFLNDLVPESDETMSYVRNFIDSFPEVSGRFSEKHKTKALIRTYLAVQVEPGLPFGTAIKARYFAHDGQEVVRLIDWIKCVLVA